jgi:hypothetical protein
MAPSRKRLVYFEQWIYPEGPRIPAECRQSLVSKTGSIVLMELSSKRRPLPCITEQGRSFRWTSLRGCHLYWDLLHPPRMSDDRRCRCLWASGN